MNRSDTPPSALRVRHHDGRLETMQAAPLPASTRPGDLVSMPFQGQPHLFSVTDVLLAWDGMAWRNEWTLESAETVPADQRGDLRRSLLRRMGWIS